MEIKDWPITIPKDTDINGFKQKARDNTIRTQMEAGIDKLRRRYTTPVRDLTINRVLTFSQYEDMEYFYNTTLRGGVDAFMYPDPATGVEYTHRIVGTPDYVASGVMHYRMSLAIERLD